MMSLKKKKRPFTILGEKITVGVETAVVTGYPLQPKFSCTFKQEKKRRFY